MRSRPRASHLAALALALAALASAALSGCDERAAAGPPDAAPTGTAPPSPGSPPPAPPPDAAAPGARPPAPGSAAPADCELRVLKAVFTSEVKNREPTDVLKSAKPGQRVYAHLTVRNRCEAVRTLELTFKASGSQRAKVDLDVDPSWSFRTWGYATLRKSDAGKLDLEVKDDSGAVLLASSLPIKPDDGAPAPLHR